MPFVKGNTIGKDTRFQPGHTESSRQQTAPHRIKP